MAKGTRPIPTNQIIAGLVGNDQRLAEAMHHGLAEIPFQDIYPFLDFDELLAFAAASWELRSRNSKLFNKNGDIYGMFNETYKNPLFPYKNIWQWLNHRQRIDPKQKEKYDRLNPFQGENLKERVQQIPSEEIERLHEKLQEATYDWIFECQYQDRKRMRDGNNTQIRIMNFQNVYPKAGRIIPAYVKEITIILRSYPTEVRLPEKEKLEEKISLF